MEELRRWREHFEVIPKDQKEVHQQQKTITLIVVHQLNKKLSKLLKNL